MILTSAVRLQALFDVHWTTPWTQYKNDDVGVHLMNVPGEVRDKIIGMVLPMDLQVQRKKMQGEQAQSTNILVIAKDFRL